MLPVATLLAFEAKWGAHTGGKEEAIRHELGVTPARYYQLLGRAIDTREALELDPLLVHRLRDARARHRRRRSMLAV
ncbi:DUF3263 domain-containing protein [Microbacterium hominis]|uniref:DUF3263 domain-containing protein n=1 Tax=Microbacterium TaxID=33882 RepID=UPI00168A5B8F|nr:MULTISPECIES: DUF3263 domain-containing protein [Microbacterium]QOC25502.1 DUF3263 domain-containing protein [Microbacterium hominis]QOC29509.1 DUF3263 domain-containing protein [Microbacterium hominis]QYF98148.1 DUF3263 domain-containing protein [Microbacterium sp. PAMC21962]